MPTSTRTLLVAPETNLEYGRREVDQVVTALRPTLVSGEVAVSRLLETNAKHDIVWFVAHGTDTGIQLSDRELSLQVLGSLVAAQGATLVVLNTCDSATIAVAIHEAHDIDVIATITSIDDTQAYATGARFAQALAGGMSVTDAYRVAKPLHNTSYIHLRSLRGTTIRTARAVNEAGVNFKEDEYRRWVEQVNLLAKLVEGDQRIGLDGLVSDMRDVKAQLTLMEKAISELNRLLEDMRPRPISWAARLAVGFVGVVVTLGAILTIWAQF